MNNPIFDTLSKFAPLTEQVKQDLNTITRLETWPKQHQLLAFGKVAKYMFFIQKGLARAYYEHDGRDVTDYFAIDGQFIGAVPSLLTKEPTHKAIELIEESQVYYFLAEDMETLCAKHHVLETAFRRLSGFALMVEQQRIESLRFYSAKERYEMMERLYPGISNRSPLSFIASYIGISQVSLSRIRAGIQ